MLGEKRSFSGAKARLFNDADRPKISLIRAKDLFSVSLINWGQNPINLATLPAWQDKRARLSRATPIM
jgi:hypothetical protein